MNDTGIYVRAAKLARDWMTDQTARGRTQLVCRLCIGRHNRAIVAAVALRIMQDYTGVEAYKFLGWVQECEQRLRGTTRHFTDTKRSKRGDD